MDKKIKNINKKLNGSLSNINEKLTTKDNHHKTFQRSSTNNLTKNYSKDISELSSTINTSWFSNRDRNKSE